MKKLKKPLMIILPVSFLLAIVFAGIIWFSPIGFPAIKASIYEFDFFDFRFSYTADNIMTILSHYNGDRDTDLTRFYVLDFIFAFFFAVFSFTLPLVFYINNDRHYLLFRASAFSAVMAFVFNVIENILLLRIVYITPCFNQGDADMASGITSLKWAFIGLWIVSTILFILATLLFGSKVKAK